MRVGASWPLYSPQIDHGFSTCEYDESLACARIVDGDIIIFHVNPYNTYSVSPSIGRVMRMQIVDLLSNI